MIREANGNSFNQFHEGIEPSTEASSLYKAMAKDKAISSVCVKQDAGKNEGAPAS